MLSGGQYDKLLQKLGRSGRAIGFALYLSMLERQNVNTGLWDLDTLILHDGSMEPAALMSISAKAAEEGSVLVATAAPADRRWKKQIRITNGEVNVL